MRVLFFSDSHVPRAQPFLPESLLREMERVDLVLGLGDYASREVLEYIWGSHIRFEGVCGNMDPQQLQKDLPQLKELTLEGYSFVLVHGWGAPNGLEKRILSSLDKKPQVCLFGHSHVCSDRKLGGVRFMNPGPCQPGGSFGTLAISATGIQASWVSLD